MSDNVQAEAVVTGGATFGADDISGVLYPRSKLIIGADGVNDGDVSSTNPLPVTVGAALPAGNNNVGDVDVASLPAGSVAGATAKTADYDTGAGTDTVPMFGVALPANGGAVAGGTSSNPVRIDPTGSTTQPVSGTVTANAGTNLNTSALALESGGNLAGAATSLAVIDDWDESDRAKVNLIVGQAGIAAGTGTDGATVPRVTLATNVPLPAGTNAIGKLAANSGVDIGDVDVTSVSGNVTVVQGTAANLNALAAQGAAAAATAGWPIIFGRPTSAALSAASVSASSSGENTLVSGTGGQTIRVFKIFLVAAAAVDIKFKDAASGSDLTGAMSLSAGGSFVLDFDGDPWLTTATAGALILNLSSAVQVSGRVYYVKS